MLIAAGHRPRNTSEPGRLLGGYHYPLPSKAWRDGGGDETFRVGNAAHAIGFASSRSGKAVAVPMKRHRETRLDTIWPIISN